MPPGFFVPVEEENPIGVAIFDQFFRDIPDNTQVVELIQAVNMALLDNDSAVVVHEEATRGYRHEALNLEEGVRRHTDYIKDVGHGLGLIATEQMDLDSQIAYGLPELGRWM